MDSDFIRDATAGDIRNGVRHEALHMFGAHHTGEMDSRDGFISTLKTCKSGYNLENVLTQDDAISLQYVSDTGYKNFGADPGFESSTHFYGLSVTMRSTCSSSADNRRSPGLIPTMRRVSGWSALVSAKVRV